MSVLRLRVRQQRGSDQLLAARRVSACAVTAGGGVARILRTLATLRITHTVLPMMFKLWATFHLLAHLLG